MRLPRLAAIATTLCLMGASPLATSAPKDRGRTPDTSLRDRLAFGRAQTLLASDVLAERVQALERLGSTKAPRAVERLIVALQPGSGAPTAEERLTAVRELAFHTEEQSVRRALARVVGGHAASSEEPGPLDALSQETAALALARAGTSDALAALGRALSGGGAPARAAIEALVAHPPRDLAAVVGAVAVPTEEFAAALSELGDQRAFEPLRTLVQRAAPEVRARAAIGLTDLGDYETVALARVWVRPSNPDELRLAGARILALVRAPEAPEAIRSLLDGDRTWRSSLDILLDAPTPGLAASLSRRLSTAAEEEAPALISAIGRGGGADAARALERELRDARRRPFALDALARTPDDDARLVLERALGGHATRRAAALALAVRSLEGNTVPRSLPATLESLSRSPDHDDRVVGAVSLALIEPKRIPSLLRSADPRIRIGGAAFLPLASADTVRLAAGLLPHTDDKDVRTAFALVLVHEDVERLVPTETLLELIDDKSPATPLAARALSARDDERTRPTVDALVGSSDPVIRLHATLGLGRSTMPDASGRLAAAYRFEADPAARWAILSALSHHAGPIARRTLEVAAALDPDRKARSAARIALGGASFGPSARGYVALLSSTDDGSLARRAVAIRTPEGLALPAFQGSDGLVIGLGLPPGSRVAPGGERGKDEERGASGDQENDHTGER